MAVEVGWARFGEARFVKAVNARRGGVRPGQVWRFSYGGARYDAAGRGVAVPVRRGEVRLGEAGCGGRGRRGTVCFGWARLGTVRRSINS